MPQRNSGRTVSKLYGMYIPVRVKAELDQAADREGCSLKDYLLAGAYERLRRKPVMKPEEYEEIVELHEQLRRVGINLNSLLRSGFVSDMSGRRGPMAVDFQAILDELVEVSDEITDFMGRYREWAD